MNRSDFLSLSEDIPEDHVLDGKGLVCGQCGVVATDEVPDSAGTVFEENTRALRQMQQAQESGINVEYRCIKGWKYTDCRNASKTEKISILEEAEDQAIKDSVSIDWVKKNIVCSLPLRGKKRTF